jgi:hypothetical protein
MEKLNPGSFKTYILVLPAFTGKFLRPRSAEDADPPNQKRRKIANREREEDNELLRLPSGPPLPIQEYLGGNEWKSFVVSSVIENLLSYSPTAHG